MLSKTYRQHDRDGLHLYWRWLAVADALNVLYDAWVDIEPVLQLLKVFNGIRSVSSIDMQAV